MPFLAFSNSISYATLRIVRFTTGVFMRQVSNQEAVPNTDVFPITEGPMDYADPKLNTQRIRPLQARDQSNTQEQSRQAMRVRRFFLACFFSILYLLAVAVFYWQGLVDREILIIATGCVGFAMAVFYGIFSSGLNKKAAEKNLTAPIILCALALMLWITYVAPASRIIFTPFVFVIIAYGMYRLTQRTMLLLSLSTLAGYAAVIGLHYTQFHDAALLKFERSVLKLEMLHWFVLAITLPSFVMLTGRVQRLHNALLKAGRKIKNIEEHARRDQLIGCYNRRYMVAALEEQKRLADETGTDLCLAVIDLDHFKLVNDEVGHLAGDEVLRTFARIAQDNVRQGDVFGRYGGEEFLLVLPETSLLAALNSAERIREQVETYAWNAKLQRSITVSIGLTQYISGESVLDLFSRADTAMYLAKRGGRNQVVVEEPTVELWQAPPA